MPLGDASASDSVSVVDLESQLHESVPGGGLKSAVMNAALGLLEWAVKPELSVQLRGESGTGCGPERCMRRVRGQDGRVCHGEFDRRAIGL